ncbi:MAG: hypothetical protein ACOCX8_01555 [Bacteroidota bacterium]
MDHYLEQLIEDMKKSAAAAAGFREEELTAQEPDEENLFADVEGYLYEDRRKLSEIVGISKAALPAVKRLKPPQIERVFQALKNMLEAWNFYPEFPEHLPVHLRYAALRDAWDSEYYHSHSGMVHLEFCDYDSENCPFPDYCNYCDMMNSDIEADNTDPGEIFSDLPTEEHPISDHFSQLEDDYFDKLGITDEEGFIPGIHNYCDRWCERCRFTERCRVFAMEKELRDAIEKRKEKSDDSDTEHIDEDFQFVDPEAEDEPVEIEFEFEEDMTEDEKDFFSAENKSDRHPIWIRTEEYADTIRHWLIRQRRGIHHDFTRLIAHGYADEVMEAINVLEWYHIFIAIKFKRALTGYFEQEEFEEADFDMNGSAKVALIGLDRSLDALRILHRHLKIHRKFLQKMRTELEDIRLLAEEIFPEARSFVRPGLDEV